MARDPDLELGVGRALVVGARVTGRAVVDALRAAGVGVVVVDEDPAMLEGLRDDVEALAVADARPLLERVDVVVPSPGVAETSDLLRAAAAADIPVWSEPELAWRLRPRRVVGVTGTNGKTSVTELITAMLAAGGVPARACGNIGTPMVEAVLASDDEVLVAELSSFQLRYVESLRCEVGVVLNVAPDHLDWHGGFGPYGAAKARLWAGQHAEDWAVTPDTDELVATLASGVVARRASFSGNAAVTCGVGVVDGWFVAELGDGPVRLLPVDDVSGTAPHHRSNVAAAATVALLAGADAAGVAAAARAFRAGAHRGEVVGEHRGVTFIDDSKATNPHAAAAALAAPVVGGGRTVWLAGGLAKGVDLSVLAPALVGVRHAIVFGEAAALLADTVTSLGIPVTLIEDGPDPMGRAVRAAAQVALAGDRVLLSPACASFDQFSGYADRGERFMAAVEGLTAGGAR